MPEHSTLQMREVAHMLHGHDAVLLRAASHTRQHRSPPVVRLRLLDDPALYVGHRELPLSSRKAKALVAYLALAPGMKESRDRLAGLFWSESEDAKARASLRQLLHLVRETFEEAGLEGLSADKSHVSLNNAIFKSDLEDALAGVDRGAPADILVNEPNITDSFLRGFEDIDPSFGSWLAVKRESVRQMLIRRLEAQLTNASHCPETVKRIARALFQIDPTHEIACQKLMQACIASGNTGGALAAYKQLWDCLEEEYDIEPSAITQELVVAIKCGRALPDPRTDLNNSKDDAISTEADRVTLLAIKLALSWMSAWDTTGAARPKRQN